MLIRTICACFLLILPAASCQSGTVMDNPETGRLVRSEGTLRAHVFYYSWYGNPETDGGWRQWNHQVMLRNGGGERHVPPEDIGASFYPGAGLYSSMNPADVALHMEQLKQAGAGVAAATWWGANDFTEKSLEVLFDAAAAHGVKVCFHIEPFPGRNAATMRDAIVYLLEKYGDHPALYRDARYGGRTFFYVYDSYLTPAEEWAAVLAPDGENTIHGTDDDAVVIGLWVKKKDGAFMETGHFDGFYTYFAVDGFTYGSTIANWPEMAAWAEEHDKLFIPSVGPGYHDLRVRPWNTVNVRDRENGAYYDRMFAAALAADPPVISICSFNEWHEGTQIEPAVPKKTADYTYFDYGKRKPGWYLDRTRHWIARWLGE
jgi:glycoprotein endo-alpha-1,2-mannosidase